MLTRDLVSDLLVAKSSSRFDMWEFIEFIEEHEPNITLREFKQRLDDEVYYCRVVSPLAKGEPVPDLTAVLHCFVVIKPDETA